MKGNLLGMASNLLAMASNLLAIDLFIHVPQTFCSLGPCNVKGTEKVCNYWVRMERSASGLGRFGLNVLFLALCLGALLDRDYVIRNKCIASSNKCLTSSNKKLIRNNVLN